MASRLNGMVAALIGITAAVLLNVSSAQGVRRTVVAVVMPLLIAHTVLRAEGPFGKFLEIGFLRWIGRLSYSLYIWQMLFLPEGPRPLGIAQSFPLALLLPLICAASSYYLVEKPMIRMGHRLAAAPGERPSGRFE
jgi:peptidoglycan/LPS O-acetylase OafA/YrhL